ncbi:Uncharacterised protein [Algoriella xinjiangensis]|uniref:DUF4373 domain-containing protein n=1 Tax=Algoriella xinjiangensis TaxID=684065 RepID=UPI000F633A77|nr:DUF4373 domain-containing protein [Algoriella xinjiangensis]VDH16132.1 Uncharacterised protein [Algoriella xinjiangensis]
MARPTKKGIDYFSFDVDFFEDEKIEPISGEFGPKGELVVIRLLCAIYRNGYFLIWNEQLKMTLANRCKVSFDLIDQIIHRLAKWNFIDENLFISSNIITSKGIQTRFKEATRKRKLDYENLENWLIFDENGVSSAHNSPSGVLMPSLNTQSKVNNNTYVLLNKQKEKNTKKEIQTSTSESFLETQKKEKEKSSAKKEKDLEGIKNFLVEYGAVYDDVSEWFRNRIVASKPTTRYVMEKFILECKKNNITVKEAVYLCAFNGWINFNPIWVFNQNEKQKPKSSKNGKSESSSPNKAGRVDVDKAGEFLDRRRKERELQSSGRTQEEL